MGWTRNRPVGLVYHDTRQAYPGYTLFSSIRGCHATLLDMEGRICHRWHWDEGIQYAYLLPDGNLLARTLPPQDAGGVEDIGGSSAALLELDWDSNVVWEYRNPLLHHDHLRLPSGNTMVLLFEKLPDGLTSRVKGGRLYEDDPDPMWGDVVQEIAPDGTPVWEWRSWEHLDFENDAICPLERRREWTHTNSVHVTTNGDVLLSLRQIDTVGIVDRATGEFRWKWGRDALSHQHHATFLDTGRVLIFDNGSHRYRGPNYSQVVEVDPANNEITWTYRTDPLVAFYSFFISGAERLPNGNTLITEGAEGHLLEVTASGEVVWEYISPFFFQSKFGRTSGIFRAHRYHADSPELAGRDLDPDRYDDLNRLIASGFYVGEDNGVSSNG